MYCSIIILTINNCNVEVAFQPIQLQKLIQKHIYIYTRTNIHIYYTINRLATLKCAHQRNRALVIKLKSVSDINDNNNNNYAYANIGSTVGDANILVHRNAVLH